MLWVEILSHDDRMVDMRSKADELIKWCPVCLDHQPNTLASELRTVSGVQTVAEKTLRLPNSPIVIPLPAVMED